MMFSLRNCKENKKCEGDIFTKTIVNYWDERSSTYSNGVRNEFNTEYESEYRDVFQRAIDSLRLRPDAPVRVLDLGCGPGFFSAILSEMGCDVTALDSSFKMIEQAYRNVVEFGDTDRVTFVHSNVDEVGCSDESFDLIVMRNVTWLLRDPDKALYEWKRVLAHGGRMLIFDANWYRYLIDDSVEKTRLRDQLNPDLLGYERNARASDDQEARCEKIALSLPLTYEMRPEWDVFTLKRLGFRFVDVDENVWQRVWSEGEKAFYSSSPLFLIEAMK